MRVRRLRVTQRALFGRNCQRTARPGDECAPETSPRLLPRFVLANPALSTRSFFFYRSKATAGLGRFWLIHVLTALRVGVRA